MNIVALWSRIKVFPYIILLAFLALVGGVLLKTFTPMGLGQINDSTAYIAGARSILLGLGYSEIWLATDPEPIIHYPPLLSSILAFIGIFGLDPVRGIRVLNIFLYISNIFLLGILGWRMTGYRVAGLVLAFGFSLDGVLLRLHAFVISEPLFIFLLIISLIILDRFFEHESKSLLFLAGLSTGLAILTRYLGLTLLATIIVLLFLRLSTWRKKFLAITIYLSSALPLFIAWVVRNKLLTGIATDRGIGWHPISIDNIRLGISNFSSWIFPITLVSFKNYQVGGVILSFIYLALLIWVIRLGVKFYFKPNQSLQNNTIAYATAVFALIYTLSLIASISFFDGTTKLQDRFLAPIYVSFLVLLTAFSAWLWMNIPTIKVRVFNSIMIILLFTSFSTQYFQIVDTLHQSGLGYASARYQKSPVAAHIRQLPEKIKIYTNSPPAVYSSTDRPSYMLFLGTELDGNTQELYSKINYDVRNGDAVLALYGVSEDIRKNKAYTYLTKQLNLTAKYGTHMLFGNNQ
ncbi:MAG: hypothetical protein QGD88_07590 [Anaerolineae bacterium]|nr:hypothetical protein [Anaerolineae bacterium]MDK1081327.1 hypothetical protein [Anaerolineae bacterium]